MPESPPAWQDFSTINHPPALLLRLRNFIGLLTNAAMALTLWWNRMVPLGPLTPKMYAPQHRGIVDKSMQQTAYIMSARETCVAARLLPSVTGRSDTPGLLWNTPPKAFSAFLIAVASTQAGFSGGTTSSSPRLAQQQLESPALD